MNKCLICDAEVHSYQTGQYPNITTIVPGHCDVCKDTEFEWIADIIKDSEIVDTMEIKATPQATFNICNGQSKYWKIRRK